MVNFKLGRKYIPLIYVLIFWLLAVLLGSCGSPRPFVYMQGQFDTAKLSQIPVAEPVIKKADLLSIIVYSDNPQATALYNQTMIAAGGGSVGSASALGAAGSVGGALSTPGYLVDEKGNIPFQNIGLLHVEGLTRSQLIDTLNGRLDQYLTHPYYNIRFLNYRFTVVGE